MAFLIKYRLVVEYLYDILRFTGTLDFATIFCAFLPVISETREGSGL
jgi:hypothetical protein